MNIALQIVDKLIEGVKVVDTHTHAALDYLLAVRERIAMSFASTEGSTGECPKFDALPADQQQLVDSQAREIRGMVG